MKIKVENEASNGAALEEQRQPLLEDQPIAEKPKKIPAQKAMRKTFKGTTHLANFSPQVIFLHSKFYLPFSHIRNNVAPLDERGKVIYGLAMFRGMWVIDGSVTIPLDEIAKYGLRYIDFFHGIKSILVFGAITMFDQNVVKCFYPTPSEEAQELFVALPIGICVICSLLFVVCPST
ncbi:hypothetical protein F0562_010744 [Nyssa sinensis]|uniref:Uncharacterized protein n=1 Tax=Nyssa sinensis TaxID=561372 RepID=A0A5J5A4H5_9ASTE|nr:hypothetical protein F0562_010744 [Nyssa sinensis]